MRTVGEKLDPLISSLSNGFQKVDRDALSPVNLRRNSKLHGQILECYDYTTMSFRFVVSLVLLLLAVTASAQNSNISLQPDLRVFTAMAALNAAGFNVEFGSRSTAVREAVRKYADEVDPDLIARLKAFYAARKNNQDDEAQLAKYISLAVNLTDAPAFKPVTREEALPPDARSVIGFAELMREYYEKAHLSQHWTDVRPEYDRAIARVGPVLRDLIVRTDAYMRIPLGTYASRTLAVYMELAAPINTVNVRSNQDSYYVVLGDSAMPRVEDIRHAYLHFQLDRLVGTNVSRIQNGSRLLNLVKRANGVD